jgi:predicted CoA-substrate-specific enzyme activase
MRTEDSFYLGVDIGSVSVKLVIINQEKEIVEEFYQRHRGQPVPVLITILERVLSKTEGSRFKGLAVTGAGGELVVSYAGGNFVNEIVAHSTAASELLPHVRTVIEMGGEDSKLIMFEKDGANGKTKLKDFAMNTQCAAGTGSFLDQQASRLGISIEKEFASLALKSAKPPRIAGRCSVFAKSDMIHLQQIGTPDYDILAGLCYALTRSFKSNLGKGKNFERPISFHGGVAANSAVVRAFEDILGLNRGELIIPRHHFSMGAIGAVLFLMNNPERKEGFHLNLDSLKDSLKNKKEQRKGWDALSSMSRDYEDEVVLNCIEHNDKAIDAYLGIDVGSLSTNVVIVDRNKRVLARRYLKTAGRPLEAVSRGLHEVGHEVGERVRILGVGTTGSGRYLTAEYVGGDTIINEITAQATAAVSIDAEVDTILEIGGQDSKYISIRDGKVVDFEMNKVCAAGTGSFLEEQAEKLGINIIKEFGDMALGAENPCKFGDRCTVFMESDLVSHQQKGEKKEDLVAGLAYSIVFNYINRVVGERQIGDHIFFQGGVAWNKGVVAAFEKVLGKKITVPPHHDVTGAIGAAIHAMAYEGETRFKGFDLSKRRFETVFVGCRDCENMCEIRKVQFEGERPLYYGARCEKFEIDQKKTEEHPALPDLFKERNQLLFKDYDEERSKKDKGAKTIGIPRVLHFYERFPFWQKFFKELGFEVVLSDFTNQNIINVSVETETAETCFPIKITHGHVLNLIDKKVDYIFLPSIINSKITNPKITQNYYCPLVQASPFIMRAAIDFKKSGTEFLCPILHFQRGRKSFTRELVQFGKTLGLSRQGIIRAIYEGEKEQEKFHKSVTMRGQEILRLLKDDEKAFVIISRPYNGCDPGMNIGLPRKLKNMGVIALPMDFLPLDGIDVSEKFPNMYWSYGQKILCAAEIIRKDPRIYAVYLSNFKCGPDSFLSHFVQELMGDKLMLDLELDEHSADAGVITRCEAFLDSLENVSKKEKGNGTAPATEKIKKNGFGKRAFYFPRMSDHAFALAAAFRACNISSDVLDEPDARTVELGKKYSSGKECFPFIVTTGDLLKKIESPGFDVSASAFFMPSSDGPCRFGQYHRTQRMILDRIGYGDVMILSPDSKDSYTEFGKAGNRFQRLAWKGIVAIDTLHKLVRETRPYEINRGDSDRVYVKGVRMIENEIEMGGENLLKLVMEIRDMVRQIAVDKSQERPVIGVVGEIFLRTNRFSNGNVVGMIEQCGGEAWVAPLSEWILFTNYSYKARSLVDKKYIDFVKAYIKDKVQKNDEDEFLKAVFNDLKNNEEPSTEELLHNSYSYLPASIGGEAILSIGKAVDFIQRRISGMVNVMPFTCMPGMIVSALSKRMREEFNSIPWIDLSYDGQEDCQNQTRLEAFIHQTKQYKEEMNF